MFVGGYIVFLGLISIFVVVNVLISRKVAIYSDGDNIIIVFFFLV